MTALAEAIYDVLRLRLDQPDPRISYAELARALREVDSSFEHLTHRSREMYSSLCEIGELCRKRNLPPLPALVVRADTRRPGEAYYEGMSQAYKGERIAAWREDLEAVCATEYPPLA
jgi:hypothetical protein